MRGYDRYEYEDLDKYEEDGEEQEEENGCEDEYEEEEDPQPTKEVLDYLELRQRLKEQKRKQLKKELGSTNASSREKKNLISQPKDNYGSFFGPSQPVIAQRVIEESKSLLENPNLAARVIKSNQSGNKTSVSKSASSKPSANSQRPKVTNGMHTKVQMLKNTRDYSFLLSDDAELPALKRDPPRNVFIPKSEARPTQLPERSRDSSSNTGRKVFSGREDKKPTTAGGRVQPELGTQRLSSADKYNKLSINYTKQLAGSNRTSADPRKQLSSNNGIGSGRPVTSKSVPSKISAGTADKKVNVPQKKAALPAAKTSTSVMYKPATSKLQHPVSKPSFLRQGAHDESRKPKVLPKQVIPPPKPKVTQPPPKSSVHSNRPRKRPENDDDDPSHALAMIRQMFKYNPRKFADDDDDSDMEAGFDDIMAEEQRSAKIARKEDEEERRKTEEEERRERMRKKQKLRR